MMNFAVACAISLACGASGILMLHLVGRSATLRQHAHVRFSLWFALLLALAVVAPLFLASAAFGSARIAPVTLTTAMRAATPVARAVAVLDSRSRQTVASAPVAAPSAPPVPARDAEAALAVMLVWIAGVLCSLARPALGIAAVRSIRAHARRHGTRSSRRGAIDVLTSDRFTVPVAVGYRHPAVIVPGSILARADELDLESVLLHELEHLRRYDDVTSLVQNVALSALWFNPFAHYIAGRVALEREMACDEAVIARTGKPARYASALWAIALGVDGQAHHAVPTFSSGSHTVSRMENILNRPTSGRAHIRSSLALVGSLVLALAFGGVAIAPAMLTAPSPVTNFSSAALDGGETLVAGGRRSDGSAVNEAQLYDRHGVRVATVAMPFASWSPTIVRLRDGTFLITGGMTPDGASAQAAIYDPRYRTVRSVGSMHVGRAAHTATLLPDGRVLIAGGEQRPGTFVKQTEVYDPARARFLYTVDGYPWAGAVALVVDGGDIVMFGGDGKAGRVDCASIYDNARHIYRDTGTLIRVGGNTLTFRLPNGRLVAHRLRA